MSFPLNPAQLKSIFKDETMRYVLEKNPKVKFSWGNCAEDYDNLIKMGVENLF